MITRRQAILTGLGISGALAALSAEAFDSKEFWDAKKPSDWTDAEIHELLNKSPWAKEGSINDTARRGGLSPAAGRGGAATRSRGRGGANPSTSTSTTGGSAVKWQATIRWESALPVREALLRGAPGEPPADYVLNMFGDVPGVDSDSAIGNMQDYTILAHKGDQIKLNRVEPAPKDSPSAGGTLFYFSRQLALRLSDKEAVFSTKLGPLEIKCKFTLKDMLYRGNLEL